MNYQHWLSLAAARFTHSDSPKRDAEILLSFVTGKARTYLLAFGETEITAEQLLWLETLANRREQGEPIAYLVGEREFWSLPLSVSSATLIHGLTPNVWWSRRWHVYPQCLVVFWTWGRVPVQSRWHWPLNGVIARSSP